MKNQIIFLIALGFILTFLTFQMSELLKHKIGGEKCKEFTTVSTNDLLGIRATLKFRDCGDAGTISIQCNKPIFDLKATSRIMATDNVVGLDGVGYGSRGSTEADKRTVTIKWQTDCKAIVSVLDSIIHKR